MLIQFIKFSPTSQLDSVALIQACHRVIFAFNKYLLRPETALWLQSVDNVSIMALWHVRAVACSKPEGSHQGDYVLERGGLKL